MEWIVLLFVFVCWSSAEEHNDGAVDLHYRCILRRFDGEVDLPPILLLHGLSGDVSHWEGIYEVLALQTPREVCRCDARNHGYSPKTEDFSFDLMAADVIRLLDKLKIKKALLVGQSMGGKTASVVALKYPDRVEKVVVEDMRPNSMTPEAYNLVKSTFVLLLKALDAVPDGLTDDEAREAVVRFVRKAMWPFMTEKMEKQLMGMLICEDGKCRFKMDMDFVRKMLKDPEILSKVYDGKFDGDALFIYGTLSPFKVGEAEEEIRQLFPKAQLVPIEGAGHGVHQEKPREFLSTLIKFINGNETENAIH